MEAYRWVVAQEVSALFMTRLGRCTFTVFDGRHRVLAVIGTLHPHRRINRTTAWTDYRAFCYACTLDIDEQPEDPTAGDGAPPKQQAHAMAAPGTQAGSTRARRLSMITNDVGEVDGSFMDCKRNARSAYANPFDASMPPCSFLACSPMQTPELLSLRCQMWRVLMMAQWKRVRMQLLRCA